MPHRQTTEEVEKIIRHAAERLGLPDSDPEIEEAIQQLANALTPKKNGHSPNRWDDLTEVPPAN